MNFVLREYQVVAVFEAVTKINNGKVAYLGMQTRTGKTITALTIANQLHRKNVLFLTKKKAISSIQKDFDLLQPDYKITITNYEQASKLKPEYDFCIIDEAHNFGAFPKPSKRTKEVKALCKGVHVLFLSGTPTPESKSQIFYQLWLSDYSPLAKYKNFYAFAKDWVNVKKKKINATMEINDYSEVKQDFSDQLDRFFITVTQNQAGFNQTIKEIFHTVEMSEETNNNFKKLKKDRVLENITADTPAKLLQKCHQIASGTIITDDGEYRINDFAKMEYLSKHFVRQKKIAIFYKFQSELKMIEACQSAGYRIAKTPEEFNITDKCVIYAGQFSASREGLDLKAADCIIMLNIDFSAVSYMQSINRLQSKNRETQPEIHWIFSNLGLERKIYDTVKNKQKNYTSSIFLKDKF